MAVLLKKKYELPITNVDEEIHRRLKNNDGESFIYVVPTKRKLRDLQREFLNVVPTGTAPSFHLFTLETLAAQLFQDCCSPKRILTGPAQAVLLNEAIRSTERLLQFFRLRASIHRLPAGTFQKILDAINYLKEKGVYPSVLQAELEHTDDSSEQKKLQDIVLIYEAYEKILGESFIDPAGIFKELNIRWETSTAPDIFRQRFRNVNTLFVSGFDEFSDPELTLLYNMSNIPDIGTVVSFDYHPDNDDLFGHLKENYKKILEMGFQKTTIQSTKSETFAQHVTRNLFRYGMNVSTQDLQDSITFVNPVDRQDEADVICKIVKNLVHQTPERDLSKICIAMYQPEIYTNLFREAFERYGIPANITDRYALDQSQLVVSILSLLSVQQNNFRLNDVMRALSSPYFDLSDAGDSINAGNVYEVAVKFKITAGYKTWMNRIDQQLTFLDDEVLIVQDDVEDMRLRREREKLQKAKRDLTYFSKLLSRFKGTMTPEEFKERLLALLEELHTVEGIVKIHSATSSPEFLEQDTRAYQKFLNFLDEFLEILAFEGNGSVREPLSFYIERLKPAISQVRYNVRQRYGYGVYVTSFQETRGLKFEVMIIAGLVDGEFPPPYQSEIFLNPAQRARQERYHLTEHRYLFYQAVTNFTEHLYLTYPGKDGDLELVPSSFLDSLTKIVDGEDWQSSLPPALSNTIFSEDELLRHVGQYIETTGEQKIVAMMENVREELRMTFDYMRHASAVEKNRGSTMLRPEYNGIIMNHVSPDGQASLERFRQQVYSATQLESYGRCPFQYFADRILRLNVFEEMDEGLSPLERGGFLHELLFEFYIDRRERKLPSIAQTNEQEFQQVIDDLTNLAKLKIDKFEIPDIFWNVDKELLLGTEKRKGILREFLDAERQRQLEVTPSYFEVAFGSVVGSKRKVDPQLRHEEPITAGSVKLRGKVDRIEIGNNNFSIIDYKSGATIARRKEIELGLSLQLPIYLYAVERILTEKFGRQFNGVAGLYYTLKSPVKDQLGIGSAEHLDKVFVVKRKSSQLVESDLDLKIIIDQAIHYVNDYVDGIAKGEFPVEPKTPEKTCAYCDFQTVCRIQSSIAIEQEGGL